MSRTPGADHTGDRTSTPAALLAVCLLAVVPWIVLSSGDLTFIMSWGLVNTNPWHAFWLPSYLDAARGFGSLPWSLQVWPISLGFYCGALVSAASGVIVDREDPRLTTGLLVLSAVGSLIVWQRLAGSGVSGTAPVGAVATGIVVWWFYWPALRRLGTGRRPVD
ncbi:uncharacterized protein (TIGR04206 family) [Halohasta litchfieldiae]|nr:TIGR04206 family protein [Halohasta litchfieldiae]ATW87829.1 uncharacterized protein (TIGR04206 family) [Halohasta litchfieldiae]